MRPKVSIIVPTYNEETYIKQCVKSIIRNDFPKELLEVLFVDGMSEDGTREIICEYAKEFTYIKLVDNPKRIIPCAMNIGIRQANGRYIIRLDAHSVYPKNYISKLLKQKEKLRADNVGTAFIVEVLNKNRKSCSIKKVLSNKFGNGNGLHRVGVDKPTIVDTVPFGCYKKEIFNTIGYYDERLIRKEDSEFNNRLVRNGGIIYLLPDMKFTYYARETYSKLARNNYKNGLWNILTSYYTKSFYSSRLRHFIPLAFILSLFIPILLSLLKFFFIYVVLIIILAYNALVFYISYVSNDENTNIFALVLAFYILHFSYGIGSLMGIFKVIKLKCCQALKKRINSF